ncbi:MAG: DUF4832 domain-containing protein, partial [Lachnospiraceae bacterium]|nr:DUF4832 domain-containing protein [Lachnospiraceae bacterium]
MNKKVLVNTLIGISVFVCICIIAYLLTNKNKSQDVTSNVAQNINPETNTHVSPKTSTNPKIAEEAEPIDAIPLVPSASEIKEEQKTTPTVTPTITTKPKTTGKPKASPAVTPTIAPTPEPTEEPKANPTKTPIITTTPDIKIDPTITPIVTPIITTTPEIIVDPTTSPTITPTPEPTEEPTTIPTPTPEIKEDYNILKTELIDLNYNESNLKYANPNRGFYISRHITLPEIYTEEEKLTMLKNANSDLLQGERNKLTLVTLVVTLDKTLNSPITDDGLQALSDFLEKYGEMGYQVIIRFNYGDRPVIEPDNFSTMLKHIEQVGPILKKYADIIPVYQAGFIGAYGEWHSTIYEGVVYENQVLDAMFENSSPLTQISIREPKDYRNYMEHVNNDEDVIKRFGQYNDAFLSTYSDMGTYDNKKREEDLIYMESITANTFYGGEAVFRDEAYSNITNANREMRLLHTNYLNSEYDENMFEFWKSQTVTEEIDEVFAGQNGFDYIFSRLGYRFVLKESRLTKTIKQGDNLHISISIENTGFGNPIGINNTYLLLEKDENYYRMHLDIDPEEIKCGTIKTYNLVVSIPLDLNPTEWNVYIQMSSNETSIDEPDIRFVKFANYD